MNVLVIDDSEDIRFLLSQALSFYVVGADLRTACNGSEAIQICDGFEPDIVITDRLMEGPPAEEISREIRTQFPNVRIIAFSGMPGAVGWADHQVAKGSHGIAELTKLIHAADEIDEPV